MRIEHFNLESITELGEFNIQYAGQAVGGGEWWSINTGDRCIFHLRSADNYEMNSIIARQLNYPYYCPTEKDHFFLFENKLYHVNPAKVDPLAEMIILYFSQMTKKFKPEIKKIQKEFSESLNKIENILKKKAEKIKNDIAKSQHDNQFQSSSPHLTSSSTSGRIPETVQNTYSVSVPPVQQSAQTHIQESLQFSQQLQQTPTGSSDSDKKTPVSSVWPKPSDSVHSATLSSSPAKDQAASQDQGAETNIHKQPDNIMDEKELQKQRMKERRKRLGLPEDLP